MKKVYALPVACFVVIAAAISAPAAIPSPGAPASTAYVKILDLERARSLGDGRLAAYLNDPDPAVAARAALALGRTRKSEARDPLLRCLANPAQAVRSMCAFGLGLVGISNDVTTLLGLSNDSASSVRYAAVDAAGRIVARAPESGTDAAASAVMAIAGGDADPVVRGHAAIALWTFAGTPAGLAVANRLPALFAAEKDEDVRARIMWTVARAYALHVPQSLISAGLADGNTFVRIAAIKAMSRLKPTAASRTVLAGLLADRDWRIQLEANEALRRQMGVAPTEHVAAAPEGVHFPPIPVPADTAKPLRYRESFRPAAPGAADAVQLPLAIDGASSLRALPVARAGRPRVRIVTTRGTVTLVLFNDWAPLTVANFENLARAGFFNGNLFFRIVPDFVVQTGDRSNTGDGEAGYNLGSEENPIEQTTAVISMGLDYAGSHARRDSAATQWYITLSPQYHLDNDFTVFGAVVDGFDVLPNLVERDSVIRVDVLP